MENKKKSKFKQIERNLFINMTRNKSTKEYNKKIKEIEERTGKKPSIEIRRKIRKQIVNNNAKKMKGIAMLTATSIILAGSIGLGAGHALNESSGRVEGVTKIENSTNIDTIEIANGEIKVEEKEPSFREKYKVNDENLERENEITNLDNLKDTVTQEVEALKTDEEILNYVKKEYVEEYNKINDDKISIEDVKLYRSILGNFDEMIYRDFAQNGEEIIRVCNKEYGKEKGLSQVMGSTGELVYIKVNDKVKEVAVGVSNHFERGYSGSGDVIEVDENSLSEKVGKLLNAGAAYVTSQENDKSLYKDKLIDAMVDYKAGQAKEITNIELNDEKDTKGFEIGD